MIKLIQITDPHLVEPGERLLGLDPLARLEACLAHVNAHHADADLVVLSGDLTDDGSPAAYAALRERLAGLKALPWRLMVGNHDKRDALFAAFPEAPSAGGFLQCCARHAAGPGDPARHAGTRAGSRAGSARRGSPGWKPSWTRRAASPPYIFMHHPPFRVHLPALDRDAAGRCRRLPRRHRAGTARCATSSPAMCTGRSPASGTASASARCSAPATSPRRSSTRTASPPAWKHRPMA